MNTPIGNLQLEGTADGLTAVRFTVQSKNETHPIPEILQEAVSQLQEYFNGARSQFELKLDPGGTDFQKKVWQKLQQISFGKTASYREMANMLGDPKVIRAAAAANGKNPIAVIIPCHRVIGSDGSLTGYAGGLHRKKWLLAHESPVRQGELFQTL